MKFCAIGLGRMGRRHLQVAKMLGFDIVGVYDPLPESISLAKDEFAIPSNCIFDNVDQMLHFTKPEAIVISSTAPSHCNYVVQSAQAGVRYILCEKPMAVSIDECELMIAVCADHGAKLAINHQMRFMDQYAIVKELITTPELGGLRSIMVSGSNFGLAMNAVHYFEMFRYLTEEEVDVINFWADEAILPNPRGKQYEDRSGHLRAVTPSGVRLLMELGSDLGNGIQVIYNCLYGQILVDEVAGFMRYTYRNAEFRDLPTTRYGMPSTTHTRVISPADALLPTKSVWEAMITSNSYPDGFAGLHAVRALVSANISAELGGQPIHLQQNSQTQRSFPWA